MIPLFGYLTGVLLAAYVVYATADPYGHHRSDKWFVWKAVAKYALFWPFWLAFVFGAWLWYSVVGHGD